MAEFFCRVPREPAPQDVQAPRLATAWPKVHIDEAEVISSRQNSHVRAVIQLGGLTPADVHVQLLPVSSATDGVPGPEQRLSSTHSLYNGRFAFESPPFQSDRESAHYWLLRVAPRDGSSAEPVSQLLSVGDVASLPSTLAADGSTSQRPG